MKLNFFFSLLLWIVNSVGALGQNQATTTITWDVEQVEVKDGVEVKYRCQFITKPDEVQWLQKSGAFVTTYAIQSREGNWENVSTAGSVILNLLRNGRQSKMIIQNLNGQKLIHFHFTNDELNSRRTFQVINARIN